jgi:hypothetical protein
MLSQLTKVTRPSIKQHVGLGHSRRTMRRSEGRVGPRAEAAAFGRIRPHLVGTRPLAAGELEPFQAARRNARAAFSFNIGG